MTFKEYLESKKIDPKAFAMKERDLFMDLKKVFDQISPGSFTQQKLFLINPLRRKYPWKEQASDAGSAKPKPKMKPKIRPKT